ncbi:DUF4401 domain-containing protein [Shewanella colwelliana]|uniref:DUF4401 domain-containing protein n=1 Tax=Shewanella colwelliana TaxID=23 RepID=UPI0022AFA7CC|nr:DUF4401 domain-containing protein [Shewanella colwelliana]MCZ4336896.1 DUF4401 domain-containing protein [Shewanella colwelliana]
MSHNITQRKLWQSLSNQGLLNGDTLPETALSVPWYIIGAQMLGGWIAALFLLAFVLASASSVADITESFISLGTLLCLGCLAYYRFGANRQEFVLQMVFAFSLCGQLMLLWGIYERLNAFDDTLIALIYLLVFALHWLVIPHKINQFVAALCMVPSLLAILVVNQWTVLVLPLLVVLLMLIWPSVYRWPQHYQRLRVLGYAVGINLLMANFSMTEMGQMMNLPKVLMTFDAVMSQYMAITMILLSALWLIGLVFNQLNTHAKSHGAMLARAKFPAVLVAILISLLSIVMSGVSAALLMLLLGYFYNELKLVVLSVCGLVAFIGFYYYSLHMDLFDKSLWLMASGILLLALKFAMGVSQTVERQSAASEVKYHEGE